MSFSVNEFRNSQSERVRRKQAMSVMVAGAVLAMGALGGVGYVASPTIIAAIEKARTPVEEPKPPVVADAPVRSLWDKPATKTASAAAAPKKFSGLLGGIKAPSGFTMLCAVAGLRGKGDRANTPEEMRRRGKGCRRGGEVLDEMKRIGGGSIAGYARKMDANFR